MSLPVPRVVVRRLVLVIYALGGCIMNALSFLLFTVSVFFPVVQQLGYDPVWFGVIIVVLLEMGTITTLVGINVYVIKGVAPEVELELVFKGFLPFSFPGFGEERAGSTIGPGPGRQGAPWAENRTLRMRLLK